jgi:hypothetical protein
MSALKLRKKEKCYNILEEERWQSRLRRLTEA